MRADRGHHLGRGHAERGDLVRIEPQPHRIVAGAEHLDVADAVEAQQLVAHLQQRIVGDIELVKAVVRRQHEYDHQDVGAVLAGDDAVALHLFRQPRLRDRDAVLHQHLRLVQVSAELEGDGDGEIAVRGRLAVEIQHVLDAVDLLLDRSGNRVGNGLRGGARILRGDDDGRRHHLRIFRDRQRGVGERADDQQHDRQHHRQNGLVDGEPAEIHDLPPAGAVCGVTFGADAGALEAVDDHLVFRLQPLANDAQAFVERTQRHGPCLDGVVVLHDKHDLARLVGGDRGIRQQQRLIGRRADQPHAAELPRQDRKVLVGDDGAAAQRAGRFIEAVVEEIHLAFTRRFHFAGQRDLHRVRGIARARPLAFEPEIAVPDVGRLIDVEIDVDRIERDDRGEQRGIALGAHDEIAGTDEMAAGAAGHRRQHVGEFDIEFCRLQRAFGLHLRGMRRLQGLAALVDDGFGNRAGLNQGQRAIEFTFCQFRLGARIGKLAIGLQRCRLERPGIDRVKQVALADDVTVAEFDAVDEAADPGAHLHLFHRLEAAGEFIPVGDGAFGRLRHGDRGRRRCGLLLRLVSASGQREGEQESQRREAVARSGWKEDRDVPLAPNSGIVQLRPLPSPLIARWPPRCGRR